MSSRTAVATRARRESRAEARARLRARVRLPLPAALAGGLLGVVGSYLYWTLSPVRVEGVPLTGRLADYGIGGVRTWSLLLALVATAYGALVLRDRARTSTQGQGLARLGIGLAVLPALWSSSLVLFLEADLGRIGPGPWVTMAGGVEGRALGPAVDAGRPGRRGCGRAGRLRGVHHRHRDRRRRRVPRLLHR